MIGRKIFRSPLTRKNFTSMKECFKCNETKPLDEFYAHPQMKDGRVNKCKACNCKDVQLNRRNKIVYYTNYEKHRAMQPHRAAQRLAYQQTDSGKAATSRAKARWAKDNPVKRKAINAVNNAVRDGKLIKLDHCQNCGATGCRMHGHHDDYSKPFVVRWLCPACHKTWHKENGEGSNATSVQNQTNAIIGC